MSYLSYTVDGQNFRVQRSADLLADYQLTAETLPDWHRRLAEVETTFEIVCRHYAIFNLLTCSDADLMQPWTPEKTAARLKLDVAAVKEGMEKARTHWARVQNLERSRKAGAGQRKEGAESRPNPDEKEQEKLLKLYGFITDDAAERKEIAVRLIELEKHLDNNDVRSTAVSLVRQERNLAAIDESLSKTDDAEVQLKLVSARGAVQEKIEKTMERLGIFDAPESMRKRARFQDSIGSIVAGMQEYYAKGDRSLIDGVFTEFEVEVLLRELDLRGAQYNPLLVGLVVPPAIAGLFNPDFVQPQYPQSLKNRLRRAWQSAMETVNSDAELPAAELDLDPEGDDPEII